MPESELDFVNALEVLVSHQGGVRLPDSCLGSVLHIGYEHSDAKPQKVASQGCGERSVFVIPCEDPDGEQQSFLRFCASCDSAWAWPRFSKLGEHL